METVFTIATKWWANNIATNTKWWGHNRIKLLLTLIFAVWLAILLPASVHAALPAQAGGGYTYTECSESDSATLQAEIEAITLTVLQQGGAGFNLEAQVNRAWNQVEMDRALAEAVDNAITQVMLEESYWNRLLSGWSSQHAEALAMQVSSLTFAEPVFETRLNLLAEELAGGLVAEMDVVAARSASAALLCLQDYVGEQYSGVLFGWFQMQIQQELAGDIALDPAEVALSPLAQHSLALGGLGVIIASQLARRIAQGIGQKLVARLAGKLAARLLGRLGATFIPIAGLLIGAGMIVWDLVEGAQGALPQIREGLTSIEAKASIQAEITLALRETLAEEMTGMAASLATTLVVQWQEFCDDEAGLCGLAQENQDFRQLLAVTQVENLPHIAAWIQVLRTTQGEEGLALLLESGDFDRLVRLPLSGLTALAEGESPQAVLAWSKVAGELFDQVIAYQLYQYKTPADFSPLALQGLLALDEPAAIAKLLALDNHALAALVQLPTGSLRTLAGQYSLVDLQWLAEHVQALEP
jgi:hypothetical protein